MEGEWEVGPAASVPPGTLRGVGPYVVGNVDGEYFALTRRCRHLFADLAEGLIDDDGTLVCPWHGSKYDVKSGSMVRGPQEFFAKIPGLDRFYLSLTRVLPLGLGKVEEREGILYVRKREH